MSKYNYSESERDKCEDKVDYGVKKDTGFRSHIKDEKIGSRRIRLNDDDRTVMPRLSFERN